MFIEIQEETEPRVLTTNQKLLGAASSGNIPKIKALIKDGADITFRGNIHECPLDRAAFLGEVEVIKILLEYGADVNAVDDIGRSAMDIADKEKHRDAVEYLKSQGGRFSLSFLNLPDIKPGSSEKEKAKIKPNRRR